MKWAIYINLNIVCIVACYHYMLQNVFRSSVYLFIYFYFKSKVYCFTQYSLFYPDNVPILHLRLQA